MTRPSAALGLTWLLAALVAGCGEDPAPTFLHVVIETAAGANPLHDEDLDALRVRVRQGEGATVTRETWLEGDRFDLRLPLTELVEPIEVGVELLAGDMVRLHGALPPFAATDTGGLVRVVVGPPGACEVVADAVLETGRVRPAVTVLGSFALVAGGREPEGPSRRAGFVDLLRMFSDRFEELDAPLGAARAAPFSATEVVLLSEHTSPQAFDLTASTMQARPLSLHEGAGIDSVVLARGDHGAVVIGGSADGERVRGVSWIGPDRSVRSAELAVARAGAAAAVLEGGVLVAGGMAEGEPLVELLRDGGDGRPVLDAPEHGLRDRAILLTNASGERALLLGGTDASGAIRTDSLVLHGCSDGCESHGGPSWEAARSGAAVVRLADGGGLIGGEGPMADRRDRVRFASGEVVFEALEPLAHGRADPGAFPLPGAGGTVVIGGAGAGGPRRDIELCFPLEPPRL